MVNCNHSGVRKANGAKGLRILVQSTKHPQFVESRMEKFLGSMIVRKKKEKIKYIYNLLFNSILIVVRN